MSEEHYIDGFSVQEMLSLHGDAHPNSVRMHGDASIRWMVAVLREFPQNIRLALGDHQGAFGKKRYSTNVTPLDRIHMACAEARDLVVWRDVLSQPALAITCDEIMDESYFFWHIGFEALDMMYGSQPWWHKLNHHQKLLFYILRNVDENFFPFTVPFGSTESCFSFKDKGMLDKIKHHYALQWEDYRLFMQAIAAQGYALPQWAM